jgi:ABC-2 type transport system permease protein
MLGFLDYYRVQLKTELAVQLQYRASLLIWLIGMVVEPVVYLVVWSTVAEAQGGSVGGTSAAQFAAYFIIGMLVNHATFTWVMWNYEYFIREGILAAALLRPIHPIHLDIAANIAYKLLTLVVLLPVAALLTLAFRPAFAFEWWSTLLFIPVLILAAALRFFVEWTLALGAFWMTRVSALNQMYFILFLFFSGRLAPLDLFPSFIQALSFFLPFRWILYFPIELLAGNQTPQQALIGIGALVGWLTFHLLILRFVWQRGVREFSAVGA